ncbi:MAG: sulfurtransferase [Pseudomonadota bacterium]
MVASTSPLVSADWLTKNLEAPDLRIVDATWFAPFTNPPETGHAAYSKAHIPGAVYFDIDEIADPASELPHTVPPPHVFSSKVRKLGLGDGNRVIVYDRNSFFASARAWWLFRYMGHRDVYVLDGGLDAWLATGSETADLPPVAVERHFTSRVRGDLIKTLEQIVEISGEGSQRIVDARPTGRFAGAVPEPREGLPPGHIPGSASLPSGELIGADGRFKSADEVRAAFEAANVMASDPFIATCGSGVSAAILALGAAVTGNDLVSIYDGSWTEWASDPSRPTATGTAS